MKSPAWIINVFFKPLCTQPENKEVGYIYSVDVQVSPWGLQTDNALQYVCSGPPFLSCLMSDKCKKNAKKAENNIL